MKRTRVRLEISAFMMLCVFTLSVLSINAWALQQLSINSGVNVVYNAPMFEALTVFQPINQEDPSWTKIGYNATLSANAVKIESNSLSDLASMLTDEDQDGNLDGVTYTEDDYYTAPVYRKIDNVNVDINTGEIIGKLSDPNYPFEWYGREVTLPEGYTLASGVTHKPGLYSVQFLVQNITTDDNERILLRDGYVGSDTYTSVFCLGSCNPWGNVWTWVFGTAAITDGTDYWAYVNFNDYEHGAIDTWVTDLQGEYETENTRLTEQHNYIKLSYTIPNLIAVKRYLGTSDRLSSSGLETLVGLPAGGI